MCGNTAGRELRCGHLVPVPHLLPGGWRQVGEDQNRLHQRGATQWIPQKGRQPSIPYRVILFLFLGNYRYFFIGSGCTAISWALQHSIAQCSCLCSSGSGVRTQGIVLAPSVLITRNHPFLNYNSWSPVCCAWCCEQCFGSWFRGLLDPDFDPGP